VEQVITRTCEEVTEMPEKKRFETLSQKALGSFGCGTLAGVGLAALALTAHSGSVGAHEPPQDACAWPFQVTTEGLGNFLQPDDNARYWLMPFDDNWKDMTISGSYPNARYMSFVIHYLGNFETTEEGDHLFDAQISPDRGSSNPFVRPGAEDGTYTVTVIKDHAQRHPRNKLRVVTDSAWIAYRVYLPSENTMGGVPLPSITITDRYGRTHDLERCARINDFWDLIEQLPQFFPPGFELPDLPELATDRLWLAPIHPLPPFLGPNPDNKYVGIFGLNQQPGRILVIRGKASGFPDTFAGSPIWEPAPGFDEVQLRYWSLCNNNFTVPLPTVQCTADLRTEIDEDGYYTYVLSTDLFAPEWLPADATWLPWGDELTPKFLAFRNMLPTAGFDQTAQSAIEAGCALPPPFGAPENVPTEAEMEQAGRCSQDVMGEYYPVAVWCDESVFIDGGWQACFRAAGVP
jgi:hypothetical protein